jgi:ABC-type antimicrobial peptide transport system ATPase subunit
VGSKVQDDMALMLNTKVILVWNDMRHMSSWKDAIVLLFLIP